jgi:hypothetical protein
MHFLSTALLLALSAGTLALDSTAQNETETRLEEPRLEERISMIAGVASIGTYGGTDCLGHQYGPVHTDDDGKGRCIQFRPSHNMVGVNWGNSGLVGRAAGLHPYTDSNCKNPLMKGDNMIVAGSPSTDAAHGTNACFAWKNFGDNWNSVRFSHMGN